MTQMTRRSAMAAIGSAALSAKIWSQEKPLKLAPFHLAVINDEISQDFDHACYVASHDFGLSWIEIRGMWSKNVADLDEQQVADAQKILAKYKLRVSDLASPLFKTDFPGAPLSKLAENRDQFNAAPVDFKAQDELLERCITRAKQFDTTRIRCFDFWRLEDQKPYRAAINDKLRQAAATCQRHKLILLLENEFACNTATGPEAKAVLDAISNENFMLNWDAGNSATFEGDVPYPNDYEALPKHRIGHCHVKNVRRLPDGKHAWLPVDDGIIDWPGQLKALARDGFRYTVSLETHWRGAGTPEASTRISMAGLKKCLAEAGLRPS